MISMVEYVHQRIKSYQFDIALDLTMGNGHDTVFLSKLCQKVYAFDIQEEAIQNTKIRIKEAANVSLILDSHENFEKYVQDFDLAIMNLGYLPGSPHQIKTQLSSTKSTIKKVVEKMNQVLFIVVYPGHEEGYLESQWIDQYVKNLDNHQYNVSCFQMLNKNKSPYVIEIEKR